uniref:G-protein coupled receptors family 1 profile domain-containing protein n=1 Tax=Salvator merianae TaxID=96440 RepID=A0A8D0B714_SALMN
MVNYSWTDPSAFNAGEDNGIGSYNDTEYYPDGFSDYYISSYVFSIFSFLSSIFGILGNGMVIWLLGFRIKRNSFTTYVLNLAIADFGFVTTTVPIIIMLYFAPKCLQMSEILGNLFYLLYFSMFSTSQYLLTAISMDRCVSVFFPFWYRCHRPTYLSSIVCSLIWVASIFPPAIRFILSMVYLGSFDYASIQLMVNTCFCLPLMTISSLTLFIKICCKSKQQRKGKLLVTILVTVFFFLSFSIPLNTAPMIPILFHRQFDYMPFTIMCACLNSSVNPLIYYLVGRPKKGRSNKSMKAALQKLFKEEEI